MGEGAVNRKEKISMKTFELEDHEIETLTTLIKKKIDGCRWVIDNKSPNNPEKLEDLIKKLKPILEKLEA